VSLNVSVVIPTYNRVHLISRAVESALAAIGRDDEVIVVDDGSTDDTAAAVARFGERVRFLQEPHAGAGPTRNAGIRAARGDLIALLDSDDEWFADKIELQRRHLEAHPEVLYVFSDFSVRVEDGPERRKWLMHWLARPRPIPQVLGVPGKPYSASVELPAGREDFAVYTGNFYLQMMQSNIIPSFTLMVRREPTDALVFPADQVTGEDWQAYGRLAGFGTGAFFDTETAWQHGHAGERLTGVPASYMAEAWLAALERVWGQDEAFLADNEAAYRRAHADANVFRAHSLLREGHPVRAVAPLTAAGPAAAMRRLRTLLFF
jgi:glycosyltransferase involved in cell wall biosynthesis